MAWCSCSGSSTGPGSSRSNPRSGTSRRRGPWHMASSRCHLGRPDHHHDLGGSLHIGLVQVPQPAFYSISQGTYSRSIGADRASCPAHSGLTGTDYVHISARLFEPSLSSIARGFTWMSCKPSLGVTKPGGTGPAVGGHSIPTDPAVAAVGTPGISPASPAPALPAVGGVGGR